MKTITVQIIHCGSVLVDLAVPKDSWNVDVEWLDDRPGRGLEDVYYYVRARQTDGHCVWLSPWWVDLPDRAPAQAGNQRHTRR